MDEQVLKSPLPIVDGVGPSRHSLPVGPWETVMSFLGERFPDVRTDTWLARMEKGEVVDETGLRLNATSRYRAGSFIFYYRELQSERLIPFDERIIHQDEHILVVDKPHFLPVVPAGRFLHETLLVRLKKRERLEPLVPLHRIDRETAGVVLFSLNPKTRGQYVSLFHQRKVKKVYEALAYTTLPNSPMPDFPVTRRSRIVAGEPFFRMKEIPGDPNSETLIDVVSHMDDVTLYRLHPVTGRKHQIRLHLAALGMPIINDKLYPAMTIVNDDFSTPLKLLAKSVCFQDPLTGQERYFESDRTL